MEINERVRTAPNSQLSHLSPEDWAFVRSEDFKAWAGDWEHDARVMKLRKSNPLIVDGDKYLNLYQLDNKSSSRYILHSLRNSYTNTDTGDTIKISRRTADKVTRHDADNEAHLKSIAFIPEMIRDAIYICEIDNENHNTGFEKYRYYVLGMKMDAEDYTAKIVIGKSGDKYYYDHALTSIEKGNLLSIIDGIKRSFGGEEVLSDIQDKSLISILQKKSSLILDENGEPKVLYHGTTHDFDRFDFSKGGENTGITEYTDKKTGERVSSDSSRCMFFSDYEPQAVSYAFLGHYNELQEVRHKAQEVLSAIRSGQLGGVLNSYSSKQQFLDDVAALTPLVPSLKNLPPRISALSQEERYALAAPVVTLRDEYAGYMHEMDNGGLSNQYDNVLRQGRAVESVIRDFDRLRHNDLMVEAEFGPFSRYSWTVTGATGNGEVSLFEDSGRMVFISKETGTLFLDTIDDATADRCKAIMRDTHAAAIRRFNNEVRNSGYGASTRIYRCFLKADNPFSHDYQGSAFPDYYKRNEKYPTAYIAARQVQHAVKNDHDAVIYENIRDPFEATTYGVFSPEQILIRDVKHGCRIDRELSMPEHMELLLLKDSGVSDTDARRVLDGDDVTVSSVYARRLVPGGAEPARVSCNMLLRNTNGKIVVVNPTTGIAVGTSKDITELARAFSAFEKCRKMTRQHKAEPALAVHKIR